jgi:hypothetical protein
MGHWLAYAPPAGKNVWVSFLRCWYIVKDDAGAQAPEWRQASKVWCQDGTLKS